MCLLVFVLTHVWKNSSRRNSSIWSKLVRYAIDEINTINKSYNTHMYTLLIFTERALPYKLHTHTHTEVHACVHTRTRTHTRTHTCMHAYTHANTHAYACAHTHTHTHAHTHTPHTKLVICVSSQQIRCV